MFAPDRTRGIGERHVKCSRYRLGVLRIRCINRGCGHEFSSPFSCKGFFVQLLADQLDNAESH